LLIWVLGFARGKLPIHQKSFCVIFPQKKKSLLSLNVNLVACWSLPVCNDVENAPQDLIFYAMMYEKLALLLSFGAFLGLAACNAPAAHSQANFNAAGQALGNGQVGAGASYTGHAFADGAQATGQAIGTGAQQAGHAISHTFSGNNGQ
jgi:hypothetical protein